MITNHTTNTRLSVGGILVFAVALLLTTSLEAAMSRPKGEPVVDNVTLLAKDVASGAGELKQSSAGKMGSPIVVFEERHDSILGQLQQAVMLDRLQQRYQFRDLDLEGYLVDGEGRIGNDGNRAMSAVNAAELIERGEISSAEFMALTKSMKIHPIEDTKEYVNPSTTAFVSPHVYLIAIAGTWFQEQFKIGALDRATQLKVSKLESKLQNAPEKEKNRLIGQFQKSLIQLDPWTRRMSENLAPKCGTQKNILVKIAELKELAHRASRVGANVPKNYQSGLKEIRDFYEAREASSKTMVARVLKISTGKNSGIAMIIGAAHTRRVVTLLKNSGRPFAVIAPLALNDCDNAEESNYEAYQSLVEGKPPVAGLLEDALLAVFPPGYIKPKPISSQRWFKARTELVAMAEDYTRAVAAAGGGGGGGIPREAIAAAGGSDNWRGKYSAIDTDRAVIVIDDSKNERVLVFPIVIKSETDSQSRTVWVRARLGRSKPGPFKSESSISKEDLLMKAIERVQGQGKKPKPTPTIKPNRQTIAMLGTARIDVVSSRAEAMKGLRDTGISNTERELP